MVGSEREREREGSMRGTPVTATFVERLFSPVSVRPQKDTPKVKKYDSIRGGEEVMICRKIKEMD